MARMDADKFESSAIIRVIRGESMALGSFLLKNKVLRG
jgi:hypothetical protein